MRSPFLLIAGSVYPSHVRAFAPTIEFPAPSSALPVPPPPPSPSEVGRSVGGLFENEMPGIANRWAPLLFPPIFRAETKITPVLTTYSGNVTNTATGVTQDLLSDLGFVHRTGHVEMMAHVQISRASLRYTTT